MSSSGRLYNIREVLSEGGSFRLEREFWGAFEALVEDLNYKGVFNLDRALPTGLGNNVRYIERRLSIEAAGIGWPRKLTPQKRDILTYVEFFCRLAQDRARYMANVNAVFERYVLPYKLDDGQIRELSCKPLDEAVFAFEFNTDDTELAQLISGSVSTFYDAREQSRTRKKEALRLIVDAFDRLKGSFADAKKTSIETCVSLIAQVEGMKAPLNKIIAALGQIANPASDLRHPEHTDSDLTDEHMIEYLFYSYFSMVRLILQKQAEQAASEDKP